MTSEASKKLLDELNRVRNVALHEVDMMEIEKMTDKMKGKRLLFLFQCDLLPGRQSTILEKKADRDTDKRSRVSYTTKVCCWIFLTVLNLGMLFYIMLFAFTQDRNHQNAWFQSFILWLLIEVCLSSTTSVLFLHVVLPSVITKDVQIVKKRLIESIRSHHNYVGSDSHEKSESEFNAAKYLFVSTRVANHYPQLRESQIISRFSTPWPRFSKTKRTNDTAAYQYNIYTLSKAIKTVILVVVMNMLNFPESILDIFIEEISVVFQIYLVFFHIQLWNIFPLFAFVPGLVFVAVLHFIFVSDTADSRARVAEILRYSKKENNYEHKDDDNESHSDSTSYHVHDHHTSNFPSINVLERNNSFVSLVSNSTAENDCNKWTTNTDRPTELYLKNDRITYDNDGKNSEEDDENYGFDNNYDFIEPIIENVVRSARLKEESRKDNVNALVVDVKSGRSHSDRYAPNKYSDEEYLPAVKIKSSSTKIGYNDKSINSLDIRDNINSQRIVPIDSVIDYTTDQYLEEIVSSEEFYAPQRSSSREDNETRFVTVSDLDQVEREPYHYVKSPRHSQNVLVDFDDNQDVDEY